jgi:aldose 1-epimerase
MSTGSSEPPIRSHLLESGCARVSILSLGCITQDWQVPVPEGWRGVVLGHDAPEAYRADPYFLGQIVGRVANRIAGARFAMPAPPESGPHPPTRPLSGGAVAPVCTLAANDGPHCLHGGPDGLGRRVWAMEPDGARAVRLQVHSPDGDQGFPGAVDVTVTIALDGARLSYAMVAHPDRPTPIALAQHSYYTLAGRGPVDGYRVSLAASACTPAGPDLIPTGAVVPVAGTPCDFRVARPIGARRLDLNLVLDAGDGPAAEVTAGGLRLRLWTDQPGLQLYTGDGLGAPFAPRHGLCLEPQGFPNAVNMPAFPSVVCTPERPYRQTTTVEIAAAA